MSRSKQELAKASKLQKSTETIIGGVWFSHYEWSRLEFNVPSEMFAKGKYKLLARFIVVFYLDYDR